MPQRRNKQTKGSAQRRTVSQSPSRDKSAICGYPGKTGKPCGQTILTENGRCRRHASLPGAPKGNQNAVEAGAPEGNQNAAGHGAPEGNQNARRHGLFSSLLGGVGREVYTSAKQLGADELGRETAEFLVAKMAEAYRSDQKWDEAKGVVREILSQMVDEERIDPDYADALAAKLQMPDLATLGKALGPLKGLLEVKKQKGSGDEPSGEQSQAGDPDAFARAILEELGEEAGGE